MTNFDRLPTGYNDSDITGASVGSEDSADAYPVESNTVALNGITMFVKTEHKPPTTPFAPSPSRAQDFTS